MKNVLILGAGLVSGPIIRYLLDANKYTVTCATRTPSKLDPVLKDHPNSRKVKYETGDHETLDRLVRDCDIAVSLLPYIHHVMVARVCLKYSKHLVTTSYVSADMKALDGEARKAGVLFLNEIGLDPGIDHMSAMKIIDDVRAKGGKVTSFVSVCGGLPAPEANDNPFGYKFSWSPTGVLRAGLNPAKYMKDGRIIEIKAGSLFDNYTPYEVPGIGTLEMYPNRDSISYIDTYNLKGIETMLRGTLRYPGWCETMKKIEELGYLDTTDMGDIENLTLGEYSMRVFSKGDKAPKAKNPKEAAAEKAGLSVDSAPIKKLEWLGLFGNEPVPIKKGSSFDVFAALLEKKLAYKPDERDMIILMHDIRAEYPGGMKERITSTLIDYGVPGGDSAMSRTVSLPAAIAVKFILDGTINMTGVKIPVDKEIYEPVLDELAALGIVCKEEVQKLNSAKA